MRGIKEVWPCNNEEIWWGTVSEGRPPLISWRQKTSGVRLTAKSEEEAVALRRGRAGTEMGANQPSTTLERLRTDSEQDG